MTEPAQTSIGTSAGPAGDAFLAGLPARGKPRHWLVTGLGSALLAAVIFAVIRFFWSNLDVLTRALEVPAVYWVLPTVLYLGTLVIKGLSFDLLAEVFGARVPLSDSLALTAAGLLGNYALPGNTSIPLRSLYLQRIHALKYRQFIPIALAGFVFGTAQYGIIIGAAAFLVPAAPSQTYLTMMWFFAGAGVVSLVLMLVPPPRITLIHGRLAIIDRLLQLALEGWRLLLRSPTRFARWEMLEFLRAAFEVAFFLSIARLLGVPLGIGQAIIIVFAKECVIFLRLTPGAFGIAEGIQAFLAGAFGLDVALVVLAALIGRVIEIAILSLLSACTFRRLTARIATAQRAAPDLSPR